MIKIDHARGRAVTSAVCLDNNKHMVGKQMTAETEDHEVYSPNTRRYSKAFGRQIKGRSQ